MNPYSTSPLEAGLCSPLVSSRRGRQAGRLSTRRFVIGTFLIAAALFLIAGCSTTPSNPASPNQAAVGEDELPSAFDCSDGAATTVATLPDDASICSTLNYINESLFRGLWDPVGVITGPIKLSGTKLYFKFAADWHNRHEQPVMVDVYADALNLATESPPHVDNFVSVVRNG